MKNPVLILFIFLLLFHTFSCRTETSEEHISEESCNSATPLTDLPWLKNLVNDKGNCTLFKGAKIYSYTYESKKVFHLLNPSFARTVTCFFVLYDCSGNNISPTTTEKWQDFEKNRTNEVLLWEKK